MSLPRGRRLPTADAVVLLLTRCLVLVAGAGSDGVEEIKRHPFFATIDWNVSWGHGPVHARGREVGRRARQPPGADQRATCRGVWTPGRGDGQSGVQGVTGPGACEQRRTLERSQEAPQRPTSGRAAGAGPAAARAGRRPVAGLLPAGLRWARRGCPVRSTGKTFCQRKVEVKNT